jgi:hypothetical protein
MTTKQTAHEQAASLELPDHLDVRPPWIADRGALDGLARWRALLAARTISVALRYQTGTYVCGRPGTGKTHTVLETLDAEGVPFIYRNASMSANGLWEELEANPEGTLVLDDISNLFTYKRALQVLLAALGGRPGEPRPVSYSVKGTKKQMMFNGGVVAISNLPLRRDPLAVALSSRVPTLDYEPTDDMIRAFMLESASRGYLDMGPGECLEVVAFVIEESYRSEYRLDLRHMVRGWQDRRLWRDGHAAECEWRDLVRSGMRRISVEEMGSGGRAEQTRRKREIATRLSEQYPTDRAARGAEWQRLTGDSPWTMYRHLRLARAAE